MVEEIAKTLGKQITDIIINCGKLLSDLPFLFVQATL